jgi:xanthine dehydrogenase accessory factor
MFAAMAAPDDWPLFGLASDVRVRLGEVRADAGPMALATVYRAYGASPRPPGAQKLIEADRITGYLSGGCLEADVAAHGRAAIEDGKPRLLVYGEGSPFQDIRLLCGGRLEVLVERIYPGEPAVRRLLDLRDARTPALWSSDGVSRICGAEGADAPPIRVRDDPFGIELLYPPPTRLIVVGSDPIALAIGQLGILQGFETWLLRPKGPDAPPFPGVNYDRGDPAEALDRIGLDRWTAVAAASHELELDHAVLKPALASEAFYVGVLGARRRLPQRIAQLRADGLDEAAIARLKGPIGLDIGGKAPFEIAVAVHADLIAHLRGMQTAVIKRVHTVAA